MPNTHSNLTSLFTDIATSIKNKTGSIDPIVADNFDTAISLIPEGPPDGHKWTKVNLPSLPEITYNIYDIAYGMGKYVLLIQGGSSSSLSKALYSTDLINWNTISLNKQYFQIAYGNGKFVFMHNGGQEAAAEFACTSDFTNWSYSQSTIETEDGENWERLAFQTENL